MQSNQTVYTYTIQPIIALSSSNLSMNFTFETVHSKDNKLKPKVAWKYLIKSSDDDRQAVALNINLDLIKILWNDLVEKKLKTDSVLKLNGNLYELLSNSSQIEIGILKNWSIQSDKLKNLDVKTDFDFLKFEKCGIILKERVFLFSILSNLFRFLQFFNKD